MTEPCHYNRSMVPRRPREGQALRIGAGALALVALGALAVARVHAQPPALPAGPAAVAVAVVHGVGGRVPLLRVPTFDARRRAIGPTFLHPRCTNCHGFHVPNQIGLDHAGRPSTCSLCHTILGWHAPDTSFDWAGKTVADVCAIIKQKTGGDPVVLGDHLRHDRLVQWAIDDGAVFGSLSPGGKAPPGNLGIWTDRVNRWVAGGMRCE